MSRAIDIIMVVLAVTNFAFLGSNRLTFYVRLVACQGILLGCLPLLAHDEFSLRVLLIAAGTMAIKGVVFPRLLHRVIRDVSVTREVQPYIGYGTSMAVGAGLLFWSLWLGARLVPPVPPPSPLIVPVAFFTMMNGFLLLISRRTAIAQVLGYLVLENGIYTFGAALIAEMPVLIELGVLLDVFVAVFVMGIIIFHMSREFDHVDTDRLTILRDDQEGEP